MTTTSTSFHLMEPPAEITVREDTIGHTYADIEAGSRLTRLTLSAANGRLAPLLRMWADQVELAEQDAVTAVTVPIDVLAFLAAPPTGQHDADETARRTLARLARVGLDEHTLAVCERRIRPAVTA